MSLMKRFAEQVAEEMGKENIMDPEVVAEAQRRLDIAKEIVNNDGNPDGYLKCLGVVKPVSFWQCYKVFNDGMVRTIRVTV